jgi:hypothetical protein
MVDDTSVKKLDEGVSNLREERKLTFDKMTKMLESGEVQNLSLKDKQNFVELYKLLKQHHGFQEGGAVPKGTITPDQYQSQMVDFYNQTLGTGIQTTVPIDEDEEEKKPTVDIQASMIEGKEPIYQNFEQKDFDFSQDVANEYLSKYKMTEIQSEDKSDTGIGNLLASAAASIAGTIGSTIGTAVPKTVRGALGLPENVDSKEFKKFSKEYAKSPKGKILGVAGYSMGMLGLPLAGAGMAYLSNKIHKENLDTKGAMFKIQGQNISRPNNRLTYTGTLPTGMSQQDVARIDAMRMGKLPGSLRVSDDKDNPEIIGFDGMFDAQTAQNLGGNFDAHGNWHEFKSGYIGKDFRNPQAIRSAFETKYGMSIDEYRDKHKLEQTTSTVFTGVFKRNDPTKHNQHIENFSKYTKNKNIQESDIDDIGEDTSSGPSLTPQLPSSVDLAKQYEKQYGEVAFVVISMQDYENLALNIAELRRYINQQIEIIVYYEDAVKQEEENNND